MNTGNSENSVGASRTTIQEKMAPFMRYRTVAILLVVMMALLVGPGLAISSTIPTISMTSVVPDTSVTFQTYNYPADQDFVVTMGPMGTMGINGFKVKDINSGAGGSFTVADVPIPAELHGYCQISIRLQSPQGYYSYNWFWNNTANCNGQGGNPPAAPGYTGIPTFKIVGVNQNQDVTIETHNFPADQTFTWTMGPMGALGNGYAVTGFEAWASGSGGTQTVTLPIPDALKGSYQISIRAQTGHPWPYPFYAYNWFYNSTYPAAASSTPATDVGTGGVPYTGMPTFKVCAVVKNGSVTVRTNNFPADQTFKWTMGAMGDLGYGYDVAGFEAWPSPGGSQDITLPIPAALADSYQISVRAQTGHPWPYPFYAYNWFYNNDASGFCP